MEFDLIGRLKSQVQADARVSLGIGDDCAILTPPPDRDVLITTDMLLDGVHFLSDQHSLEQIARKSMAVNISDIAAMGGDPVAAFVSLALPRSWTESQAHQLMSALANAAREFAVQIAGGDTTTWQAPLAINITLYGYAKTGEAILRSGAQPGDIICVSGPLGGSLHGSQFTFTPRVGEARWLKDHFLIHAMIDLSDGLISDLGHILTASQVGAELISGQIPISEMAYSLNDDKTPLEHALSDGEDFELLWTLPAPEFEKLQQTAEKPVVVYPIGRIVTGAGCSLLDAQGDPVECNLTGYVHKLLED